jgi:hypothetical protein
MESNKIQNVEEMLDDVMQSIQNIHGDDYSKFVMLMTTIAQIQYRISAIATAAKDPEHCEAKDRFVDNMQTNLMVLMSALCSNIATICNVEDDDDVKSALAWAEKIVDMASEKITDAIQ